MKRDTLWLILALFAAVISFLIYQLRIDHGDLPPRTFPAAGYSRTEALFGLQLSVAIINRTKRIVSNVQAISRSSGKRRYLHRGLRQEIARRYSRPAIPALFGFIDEREEGWLLGVFLQAVHSVRSALPEEIFLPDWFLFSSINNEGRIFQEYSDFGKISDLNGYANAGLDWFSKEFIILEKRGYLPPVFRSDFTHSVRTNELGKPVPTADFFEVGALFRAYAAVMANRQRVVVADCRAVGIRERLPAEVLLFYTYLYYNAGRTYGRRLVRRLRSIPALKRFITGGKGHPHNNAVTVLAAGDWLRLSGVFDMAPAGRYWWSGGRGWPGTK